MQVWVEFELIATTSALTFMVAGVFKEIVTVLLAAAIFGDEFTRLNELGLAVLISGVCLYNYQKWRKLQQAEASAGEQVESLSNGDGGAARHVAPGAHAQNGHSIPGNGRHEEEELVLMAAKQETGRVSPRPNRGVHDVGLSQQGVELHVGSKPD